MNIMLAGTGKIVYHLAKHFIKMSNEVIIVTPSKDEAKELAAILHIPIFAGDATEPAVLDDAGVVKADVVIALTSRDEDNLAICQIAGNIYGVQKTIALVNDPENEDIFRKLNVSVAVSATSILSVLIEEQAGLTAISKIVTLSAGNITVSEVTLINGSFAEGKQLKDIGLPDNALIGGIERNGSVIIPRGGTALAAGDRLIIISTHEDLKKTVNTLLGGTGGQKTV